MKEGHRAKTILEFFDSPVETDELLTAKNSVDELYALCDDPMREPVKLVDDQLHFADIGGIQDLFVDNTGFLVVGAVGMQGSGKSSLLNIMANYLPVETSVFDKPFPIQTIQNLLTNSPRTGGIDLYITQDRVILLDTQPLLSFAMTNHHAQSTCSAPGRMDVAQVSTDDHSSGYVPVGPGNWPLDVWAEMSSLQIVSFLLNVCHVVLVVTDSLSSASVRLLRLIDRAASIKPTVYLPSVLPELHKDLSNRPEKPHSDDVPLPDTDRFKSKSAPVLKPTIVDVTAPELRSRRNECTEATKEIHDRSYVNYLQESKVDAAELSITVTQDLLEQDGSLSEEAPVITRTSEIESSEIIDAVDRLKNLSDYSSALIHVYNQAPAAAFLDPVVSHKVDLYRRRILPALFPGYRRLAALITVGPRILTAHHAARYEKRMSPRTVTTTEKVIAPSIHTHLQSEVTAEQRNPSTCPNVSELSVGGSIHENSEVLSVDPKMLQPGEDLCVQNKITCASVLPSTQKDIPLDSTSDYVQSSATENLRVAPVHPSSIPCSEKPVPTTLSDPAFATQLPNLQQLFPCQTAPSEAEIDAECCMVLKAVQSDLDRLLTDSPQVESTRDCHLSSLHDPPSSDDSPNSVDYSNWNGDTVNTNISNIMNCVKSTRRNFFDIQRRLNNPRMFLIPELDDKGNSPLGCPTYGFSIRSLQEAVFSTPRQHMIPYMTEKKWLSYAHNMWEAVCTSQVLLDYYSVLKS